MRAPCRRLLRGCDLLQGAAEVHGAGAGDLWSGPGDRAIERPVQLEDTGPIAVAGKLPRIARRQMATRKPQQLAWGHIEQGHAETRQLVDRLHPSPGLDLAAGRTQMRRERV